MTNQPQAQAAAKPPKKRRTTKRPEQSAQSPRLDAISVDPETFRLVANALNNMSQQLPALVSKVNQICDLIVQERKEAGEFLDKVAMSLEGMGTDLRWLIEQAQKATGNVRPLPSGGRPFTGLSEQLSRLPQDPPGSYPNARTAGDSAG